MKRDATGKFVSNWEKERKQRFSVSLTSTAWRLLDWAASKRGISRSEAIELFARSLENEECLDCNKNGTNALIATQETECKVITILESITDAFVAFDRNWCYSYVNQAAAQILHKTPEELIGKQVWNEVFPELVGGIAYQELHRAMAQQLPVYWEEFGEPIQRWLEVNAYPSADGIAVYFRDVTERKETEAERERLLQELEMERTRFEGVLRQMPAGVLIADAASGKLVLANEQAKQIVRYDYEESLELEEYVPITPFEAFRLDGSMYAPEEYPLPRSLLMGEVVSNEEMILHQNDDNQIFISVNSAPILDRQNQIVAAVAIFQDVTERKQAEFILQEQTEALENQQKWLQTVLDLMPTPTIFIEPETAKVTFANRIANELAGGDLPKNKSLDEYADAYYCTDANGDRIPTEKMPAVLIARGEPLQNYEMNWYTPGGIRSTLCWGELLPAMYGHPATGIGMFQDVTKLKQAEAAVQEANKKVTNILESITDAFFALDREWRFTYVNKRFEEMSYRSSESLIGQCIWEVFPEAVGSVFYEQYHRAISEQISIVVEAPRTDGLDRWYEAHAYPSVDGLSVSFRDITLRKQLQLERDRLLEREQAARRQAETERKRLTDILMEVPAMFAVLSGSDHRFELANPTFLKVSARSEDIIGKTAREVFPEMEDQGYFEIHDRVYQTGEIIRGNEFLSRWDANGDGNLSEGFFNLVFLPLKNIEGHIDSILIHGIEVTPQVRARQQVEALLEKLQQKERQQQFLLELNDAIRSIHNSKEIMWQVVCATGEHFNVTRCTYGEIDPTQQYVIVDRDYCNGVISVVGSHQMNSFGSQIITELKQGKTIVVDDVDIDPRTAGSGAAAFDAIQTKSLLCVPLVKEQRFVALFVLHHIFPRNWTKEEVVLMERIAEKTWLAVDRARAEEELRKSRTRLQLALIVGRMGTWDWDMQTNNITWSEGQFTIMGLQPNECEPSYEIWAKSVHPDDLAQTETALQKAMQEKTDFHHEYRMLWADGSIHWTEARGQFTYNFYGKATRMIGVLIDITERKQVEQEREQLLERERIARTQAEAARNELKTIFETSPVGMAWLDSEQRYIAINEALAEINGLTREQHLGHSIAEIFGQSDRQLVKLFDEIYSTGNPFISPSLAINLPRRADRQPGYYNVYYLPTKDSNDRVKDVLVYVLDVTERVRLELAQRFLSEASAVLASSLDYQTTLEQVAKLAVPKLGDWCTVHIVEEDGAISQIAVAHKDPAKLEWAEKIRHKYPVNREDPRGAALTLRTGESDLIPDISDEMLVQGARDPEHLEILRSVGFKSVMTVPLRTQTRILGVISFISAEFGRRYDATDLQLAEELAYRASLAIDNAQLYQGAQRDRAKAEAANRIKDEFLAVLSHELRSPLNPILGWTKILRTKRLDPAKTEQALETIERNAKLQAQLIEDLLDVSRILQGKITLNVAKVNLAAIIEAALETVKLAAEAKNIQIQIALNPLTGTVLGDTNRLQQVVWNLLSNAVKFTPEGGQIEVRLEQVDTNAQIQVKDTGKGISPQFLPYVFDYFRQEDGTTTRKFGGLGLGLAIVRHFVELHGGTVKAESRGADLGATFTVRLPIHTIEEQGVKSKNIILDTQDWAPSTPLRGIRVLVVDDDADMRELVEFILTQAGAEVTTAASAVQALTCLNQSIPDLLVCDIGMPEMDGYSLIQHIRKWSPEQGGNILAIALTAYAYEYDQRLALKVGFQKHLPKPIDPETLIKAISELIY
ncbi:PAS domain-containing protein [Aerosakkonemataceae cyanobacterium BLCC-F50]|uniref:histidine kinase n=1 Tax=Floridaenema flaviceps BLCC-F50 TaxID=3153642 RepID=A0ABV4XJC9_9CYAN